MNFDDAVNAAPMVSADDVQRAMADIRVTMRKLNGLAILHGETVANAWLALPNDQRPWPVTDTIADSLRKQ